MNYWILTTILAILVATIAYVYFVIFKRVPGVPIVEEIWWGSGEKPQEEKYEIEPFSVKVSDTFLEDLKYRLEHTRPITPTLEDANQRYGIHSKAIKQVIDYWKCGYDWREREKIINQYPHYRVKIQGLKIHYLHIKPKLSCRDEPGVCHFQVYPLIIFHGFFGSFREFYDLIPILTAPNLARGYVFELIIPSLPGFGFSDGTVKKGLSEVHMAVIFHKLMDILGFPKYFVQGGDWGAKVAENLALLYPENVIGLHINFCTLKSDWALFLEFIGLIIPSLIYTKEEKQICFSEANSYKYIIEESGYFHIQATKPDTLGVALNDSPAGLAAYFIEKFITLTNPAWRDSEDALSLLTQKISIDKLLDNIMMYYIPGSITTAMRIYAEQFTQKELARRLQRCPITVPSACSRYPNEILLTPKSILEIRHHNLIQLLSFKEGGHFPAFEIPEKFAEELFWFVNKVHRQRNNIVNK